MLPRVSRQPFVVLVSIFLFTAIAAALPSLDIPLWSSLASSPVDPTETPSSTSSDFSISYLFEGFSDALHDILHRKPIPEYYTIKHHPYKRSIDLAGQRSRRILNRLPSRHFDEKMEEERWKHAGGTRRRDPVLYRGEDDDPWVGEDL